MDVTVTIGEHELIAITDNYYALRVVINVTTTKAECISAEYGTFDEDTKEFTKVGDASCDACLTKENGVCITDLSIHGYLKEVEVAPPPPDLCKWIKDLGGPDALTWDNCLNVLWQYVGVDKGLPFTPTWDQALGILWYYVGEIKMGDSKTGCTFATLGESLVKRLISETSKLGEGKLIEKIIRDLEKSG